MIRDFTSVTVVMVASEAVIAANLESRVANLASRASDGDEMAPRPAYLLVESVVASDEPKTCSRIWSISQRVD